eukprot:Gb_22870 [translate_table: standard]
MLLRAKNSSALVLASPEGQIELFKGPRNTLMLTLQTPISYLSKQKKVLNNFNSKIRCISIKIIALFTSRTSFFAHFIMALLTMFKAFHKLSGNECKILSLPMYSNSAVQERLSLFPFASICPKMTARQRWTPSQVQLQILEKIFDRGKGTPSKQKIKEITAELSQHGHISETNVYNWFQNRRARTKRKQQIGLPNNEESEMDNSLDLSREKKAKFDKNTVQETPVLRERSVSVQSQGVSDQHNFNSQHHESAIPFCTQVGSKALVGLSRNTSFEHGFSATRNGQSLEAMEKLNSLSAGEGYIMMEELPL